MQAIAALCKLGKYFDIRYQKMVDAKYKETPIFESLKRELSQALQMGDKGAVEPIFLKYLQNVQNPGELEVMVHLAANSGQTSKLDSVIAAARFRVDVLATKADIQACSGINSKEKLTQFIDILGEERRPYDAVVLTAIYGTFESYELKDFIELSNILTRAIKPGNDNFMRVINIELQELRRMLDEISKEESPELYELLIARIQNREELINWEDESST